MEAIKGFVENYLVGLSLPELAVIDIVEIIIIAFTIYQIILWVRNTRAWMLVKGIIFLLFFSVVAILLKMDVILWIFKNAINVGIIAVLIVFQPELRSALEQLGRKNVLSSVISFENDDDDIKVSDKTVSALVKACHEMSKNKTGALIVLENEIVLKEIEKTGIGIDAIVTSQLLINIFEHNTPLHDGAVIIRDNRIVSATCYLPMSDNLELSKELGTRHRAAVGVSEVSDSLTIIVSEETGAISLAMNGVLTRDIESGALRQRINEILGRSDSDTRRRSFLHIRDRRGKKDEE
ncbi:MAG: TIGR00159 family protein [Lachnospiraceae bacterium]|nr:TIGR00159 family protein [Lachnospiraceae bacterium]